MVEFALIFPLFFFLLLFVIDGGWVMYQRASLNYGCTHAGWGLSGSSISDNGDYDGALNADGSYTPAEEDVEQALHDAISDSALVLFRPDLLTISVTETPVIKNDPGELRIGVPAPRGGTSESVLRTRRVTIEAEVTYQIPYLTPLGARVFRNQPAVKKVSYEKIVGKQFRNAGK